MSQPDSRQSVALFRYGLIAEFVHLAWQPGAVCQAAGQSRSGLYHSRQHPHPRGR
jgi:hypothetical protein